MRKRGAIYSVIALMLCAAVYLNWSYSRDVTPSEGQTVHEVDGDLIGETLLVSAEGTGEKQTAEGDNQDTAVSEDYFSEARLSREKARDEAVNILNLTIGNENASDDAKAVANTNIQVMADNALVESRIENLVVAKGYSQCVVFINDNGVNVIVERPANGLTETDVAKIKDIVIDEASAQADQIKIIETN